MGRVVLCLYLVNLIAVQGRKDLFCDVEPDEAIVVVGENATLSCAAFENAAITSWKLNSHDKIGESIYNAPVHGIGGSTREPPFIKDGYFVQVNEKETQAILQINKVDLLQAGDYFCICDAGRSDHVAPVKVAIIDSNPVFKADVIHNNRSKLFHLRCSILFNGSANASFEISIRDFRGNVLIHSNNLPLSAEATVSGHQVTYNGSAEPNIANVFSCQVQLYNQSSNAVIYNWTTSLTVDQDEQSQIVLIVVIVVTAFAVLCSVLLITFLVFKFLKNKNKSLTLQYYSKPSESSDAATHTQTHRAVGISYSVVRCEEKSSPASSLKSSDGLHNDENLYDSIKEY